MISGFQVKKVNMTQLFLENGKRIAVTKCVAKPLIVTQLITPEKNGYQAVQVAFGEKKKVNKKEFRLTSDQIPELGSNIAIDSVFSAGETVDITGITKGRGFAGVVKRHGFKKQPIKNSSDRVRAPGSIGAQTPGKVVRGKKMPGHYGDVTQTIIGTKIIAINNETNEVLIGGPVPGATNSWITICKKK